MKNFLFCFVCGSALLFGGCKSPTSAPGVPDGSAPATIQELYPLAYGNYWVYESKSLDSNSKTNPDFIRTVEITDSIQYQGQPAYKIIDDGGKSFNVIYYAANELYATFLFSELISPSLILKSPMQIGEKIVILDTLGLRYGAREELIFVGSGDTITVPAGTFSCYHYKDLTLYDNAALDTAVITDSYYAKGVGLIEVKRYGSSSQVLSSVDQLLSYRVQ